MASTPKGYSGLAIENTTGIQQLLTTTAISSLPAGLTSSTALTAATTGMHMFIRVWNHTATGTVTVAGTAPGTSAAVTETSTTLNIVESNGMYADYTTSTVYGTVTASTGVSCTGLTGGSITIYGVQAAKRMILGQFKLIDKRGEYTAMTQRNTFAESHVPSLPMTSDPEWEWEGAFWPDNTSWLLYGGMSSAPTTTSVPNSPLSILASTPITTSGTASAASQPTAPGMILACTIAGGPSSSQSITVTGTNLWGQTITETIVTTKANGTYYSLNAFASIASNGIAYGAFGAGTLVIGGYLIWTQAISPISDTLSTYAACQYDGIGSYVAPYLVMDEWAIEGDMKGEIKLTAKGKCQVICPVGNDATFTSQVPTLSQPLDEAITGWRTTAFIDNISGTAGTIQQLDVMSFKIACGLKYKTEHTSASNPVAYWFTKADRGRRQIEVELKLYMNDQATYQEYKRYFKQRQKRLIQLNIQGLNSVTNGGTAYYPGWLINMAATWIDDPGREFTIQQEYVSLTLKGRIYLDAGLNYDLALTSTTRYQSW